MARTPENCETRPPRSAERRSPGDRRCLPGLNIRALCIALASLITAFGWLGEAAAETVRASQYDVEAAYLYNFGKFVEWPGDPHQGPMQICVLGKDPFGATLDHILSNEAINGRPLVANRITTAAAAQNCSILYIASSEEPRVDSLLVALQGKPILTVSDMPQFLRHRGMIQLVVEENRVRFSVDLDAVNPSGLVLSSELLKVAVQVKGKPGREGKR